jgi:large subunit ribosomal protein L25
MAGERIRLEVRPRDAYGSAASRRLRRDGFVPGVLYGKGQETQAFAVPERELRRALTSEYGMHAILDLILEDHQEPHHAVLKEYQLEATKAKLLHVDLQEVRLDQAIVVPVPVDLVGTPEGVVQGGVVGQIVHEVHVEALPMEVPDRLALDVSALAIGEGVRVADIPLPPGARIVDDPDTVIATVAHPTRPLAAEEVEAEALAEGEAEEAAGAPTEAESGG